jgi:hypothetical protein
LARSAGDHGSAAADADTKALADALADRDKRLSEEIARRVALARRVEKLSADLAEAGRARQLAEGKRDALVAELTAAERQIERLMAVDAGAAARPGARPA